MEINVFSKSARQSKAKQSKISPDVKKCTPTLQETIGNAEKVFLKFPLDGVEPHESVSHIGEAERLIAYANELYRILSRQCHPRFHEAVTAQEFWGLFHQASGCR